MLIISGPIGKKAHPKFMDPRQDGQEVYPEENPPDVEMKGMSSDEQKWHCIQKGFKQVKRFVEEAGLPEEYYEKFLQHGFFTANHLRFVSQHYLKNDDNGMKLTDPYEIEAILSKSAELTGEDVENFSEKYGIVEQLMMECPQGLQWWEEHRFWYEHKPTETHIVRELSFEEKFYMEPSDYEKFSFDGEWGAASCADGAIFLWPLSTDSDGPGPARFANAHPVACTDFVMDWQKMRSVSAGGDCRVTIYDFETNTSVGSVKNNSGVNVSELFLSVDANLDLGSVAVGAARGYLKIGDIETGKMVIAKQIHKDSIYGVSADFKSNLVVTSSWDQTLGVYDIRSSKRVRTMEGHTFVINRIDTNFNQMLAVSAGADETIMLWDLKEGQRVKSIDTGHRAGCNAVVVNWDTMVAATGGEDGTMKLFDLQTGDCQKTFDKHIQIQTTSLDVNWEKGWMMTTSWDVKTRIWDLQTGRKLKELTKPRRCLTQCNLKGSGRR
jgi:WD40 repeat protein